MSFTTTMFTNDKAYADAFHEYAKAGAWVRVRADAMPYPMIVRLGIDDTGMLICTGLVLGEPDGSTRVTATSLRELPLADFLLYVARSDDVAGFYEILRELAGIAGDAAVPTARGAQGHDDAHFAQVLRQFRRAQEERPKAPYKYMLDHQLVYGSYTTIRRWVERALELEVEGRIGEKPKRTRKGGKR